MVPAVTYSQICADIASLSYEADNCKLADEVTMVGLLFARPELSLAKYEIIPNLGCFHQRAGRHIHFFCAGYAAGHPGAEYTDIGFNGWVYSDWRFNRLRREISASTNWKYGGECELILTNALYNADSGKVSLDFQHAIVCRLEEMKKNNAITSVPSFFETIFDYAEEADPKDPTWGFSNAQGVRKGGQAFVNLVLSMLPEYLAELWKTAHHYAVVDIGKWD